MIEYKDIYIRPVDSRKKPFSSGCGCGCFFIPAFLFWFFILWASDLGWPAFEASVNLLIHGVFVPDPPIKPLSTKTLYIASSCLALPIGLLGWYLFYAHGIGDALLTPAEKAEAEEIARRVETEILNGTFTEPKFRSVVDKQMSHWEYDIRKLYHTSLTIYQQLPVRAPDDPPPVSSDQLR